jgi:DNA-binding transcriptional MerR regulator
MLIGDLSKQSGLSRDTLRYYEKLGLLVAASRNADNDYKHYGRVALERLQHVQRLKDVGFTLREVRQLLVDDAAFQPCANLPGQLATKIEALDQQVEALLAIKASLLDMQRHCTDDCAAPNGLPACVPLVAPARSANPCC